MHRIAIALLAALLLAGCQAKPKPSATAAAPNVIVALSDQKVVWECPKCGMDFDGPGKCSMDPDVALEKTDVAYLCPADNEQVEKAGKCPRCNMDAKVVKTAAAEPAPAGATPAPQGS